MKHFFSTGKNLLKNRKGTFPIVHYFTWKLEFVSNIFLMIADVNFFNSALRGILKFGLIKVLQNRQKRNKDFMKNSYRIESTKMKRHIKLIKTYLKPLKRDQRKKFSQKNWKRLKEMQGKRAVLWKRYLKIASKNPQLCQLKLLSTKLTFLMQKNSWWIQ